MLWPSFTTTPIYNRAALRFPQSGPIGEIEVPLHITKLSTQTTNPTVTEITYGPVVDTGSNLGVGGTAVGYGINELDKIQLEGWTDTPIVSTSNPKPGIVIDGFNVTYGEIIAAYYEGRTLVALGSRDLNPPWVQVLPKWFRDSYGRVYTSPRIIDLTLQRLENVPGRNNFTMTLQV